MKYKIIVTRIYEKLKKCDKSLCNSILIIQKTNIFLEKVTLNFTSQSGRKDEYNHDNH